MNSVEQAAAQETAAALDAARSRVQDLQDCLQQRKVRSLAESCVCVNCLERARVHEHEALHMSGLAPGRDASRENT